jgi:hypothetical protein
MKAKAQRLGGSDRPLEKVDSSSWSPPEMLESNVKTGARPLTRRAYKSGGKVKGAEAKARADRPARKSGDASLSANSLINRNVKDANAEREGAGKHIGAFKKGGRVHKLSGGALDKYLSAAYDDKDDTENAMVGRFSRKDPRDASYIKTGDERIEKRKRGIKMAESKLRDKGLMNKGGRAEKCEGGSMKRTKHATRGGAPVKDPHAKDPFAGDISTRGITGPGGKYVTTEEIQKGLDTNYPPMPPVRPAPMPPERPADLKRGGRAKKFMGGPMLQPGGMLAGAAPAGPSGMPAGQGMPGGPTAGGPDPRLGIVSKNAMNFGAGASGSPYKKGGAVKHSDEAADKALIKKMVKPSARTGKMDGGGADDNSSQMSYSGSDADRNMQMMGKSKGSLGDKSSFKGMAAPSGKMGMEMAAPSGQMGMEQARGMSGAMNKGGRAKHAKGGEVFSGKGYPFKVPGADGGRTARAAGGRTGKGKTNINIIVAAGKGPQGGPPAGGMMPPPPPGGGRPVMMPPPPPGGAGAGAPPMPMPIPMPMPMGGAGGPPPGMPPMPRKAGGRITKKAHSYKDMEAGAGSGEGRLQKTEIAKRAMHNSGGKVGHRSYSSYKDMDAGSGGGLGRLEKTEIAAKRSGIQKAY